ncbi:MAG: hypothetical protein J6D28_03805 [Bacilli bacterium]|nr:hypothetical protein [Bacilli bacterium]
MKNFKGLCEKELNLYGEACEEIRKLLISYLIEFCSIYHVDFLFGYRIKNRKSIEEKLTKKNKRLEDINDIAGIRIVFCKEGIGMLGNPNFASEILNNVDDCISIFNPEILIMEYINNYYDEDSNVYNNDMYIVLFKNFLKEKGITLNNEKNYISIPKDSGYKSYHFIIQASNGKNVEIQTRNYSQHLLAQWEHEFYKTKNSYYSIDKLVEVLLNFVISGIYPANYLYDFLSTTKYSYDKFKDLMMKNSYLNNMLMGLSKYKTNENSNFTIKKTV